MEGTAQEKTFLQVFEDYADAVYRLCYFKTYDREVAKELTQETFTKTWDYISQGNKVENMKAFVFRVARNSVTDYIKKRKPVYEHTLQENVTENIPFRGTAEEAAEVSLALEHMRELEESYRDVLIMRFVENLSVKEIAAILDERENTVSVRINRALEKLRDRLQ